ncbi:Malonyl-CoA decarboxylase (MCD) [Pannonibacter phragmitetus]|uniref:Malonyl-CoA decarboxylase (MCD) n=1 Tax=Pannonibacter phragmitetus TaxID=121719 RepID=A0A378ZWW7_9HYPH|nr:malonyl-CoA decarboxylase [Pannonibacter phragmitetus]SUB01310.1 Malonyl-CoA decarboxylase (MCD) [Pannonibacter phragmitetus]
MNTTSFLSEMLQAITERGRRLLSISPQTGDGDPLAILEQRCDTLLSSQGEASGMALAKDVLTRWDQLDEAGKLGFARLLLDRFGPNTGRLEKAIKAYQEDPSPVSLAALHMASEPRRQELIRRLNLAPDAIATLVRMREALLKMKVSDRALETVDQDFAHLFASWFNRGFLTLRSISWSTPANILEKIIRYEAVHHIGGWEELRLRLAPEDRRCFAFFHPRLADDPLIFVEVALTTATPDTIAEVLREEREPIGAGEATTAVFYSISNCQDGLRGISFGNFLIKQVVEDLRRELPKLETFVTLSPVPGFAAWLSRERRAEVSDVLSVQDREVLQGLDTEGWHRNEELAARIRPVLMGAAAWYFLKARTPQGKVVDPVARFHLGNGARLERLNFLGDLSPRALEQSHGLMVNYLYKLDDIETNHEAFAVRGEVAASSQVRKQLPPDRQPRQLVPLASSPSEDGTKTKSTKEFTA